MVGVTKAGVPAGVAEEAELCLLLFLFVAVTHAHSLANTPHSLEMSLPPDDFSQDNLSLLEKKKTILRPVECAPRNTARIGDMCNHSNSTKHGSHLLSLDQQG